MSFEIFHQFCFSAAKLIDEMKHLLAFYKRFFSRDSFIQIKGCSEPGISCNVFKTGGKGEEVSHSGFSQKPGKILECRRPCSSGLISAHSPSRFS